MQSFEVESELIPTCLLFLELQFVLGYGLLDMIIKYIGKIQSNTTHSMFFIIKMHSHIAPFSDMPQF
jgi:hypothetical protein